MYSIDIQYKFAENHLTPPPPSFQNVSKNSGYFLQKWPDAKLKGDY